MPRPDEFSSVNLYNIASLFSTFWSKEKETNTTLQIARSVNQEFPDFFLPYLFISHSEIGEKLYQPAVKSLLNCLRFYPDFPEAHRDIALCYFSLKECNKAEQHVKLYLQFSDAVTDYNVLENARKKCQ